METACKSFGNSAEACFHLVRLIDGNDLLRLLEQQSPAGNARRGDGQTVVEKDEGGGRHLTQTDRRPLCVSSTAHMEPKRVNVEEFQHYARISISPLPRTAMSPTSLRAREPSLKRPSVALSSLSSRRSQVNSRTPQSPKVGSRS